MNLENYTNINIYKRTFEERQVVNSRDMIEHSHNHLASANKEHARFNPYQNNEGTVVGKFHRPRIDRIPGHYGTYLTKFSLTMIVL